jgi:hypothetical protein
VSLGRDDPFVIALFASGVAPPNRTSSNGHVLTNEVVKRLRRGSYILFFMLTGMSNVNFLFVFVLFYSRVYSFFLLLLLRLFSFFLSRLDEEVRPGITDASVQLQITPSLDLQAQATAFCAVLAPLWSAPAITAR